VSNKVTQFLLVSPIHKHSVHLVTIPGPQFESFGLVFINQLDSALQQDWSCNDTGSHVRYKIIAITLQETHKIK